MILVPLCSVTLGREPNARRNNQMKNASHRNRLLYLPPNADVYRNDGRIAVLSKAMEIASLRCQLVECR
jgi:hypothetical protein